MIFTCEVLAGFRMEKLKKKYVGTVMILETKQRAIESCLKCFFFMKQTWIILEKEMETCTYHGDFFMICTRTSAIYLEVCICTLTQAKVLLTSLETYNKHFASDNKIIQDFRKYHHDSSYKYACRISSDVLIMPCFSWIVS